MNTFLSETDLASKAQFNLFAKQNLASEVTQLITREGNLSSFLQKMGEAGLLGLIVAKEYGGSGSPFLHAILLIETLSSYDPGIGLSLAAHFTTIELIKYFGTKEQQAKYVPLLASGKMLGTFAYLESENIEINDSNVLQGCKQLVVNAHLAQLMVVLIKREKSFDLWLVEIPAKNIEISSKEPYLGLHSAYLDDVNFKNYSIDSENKLSDTAECDIFALSVMRTLLSAAACGLLEGSLNQSAEYTRQNNKNGTPLAESQAIQWRLADLKVASNASKLLTYRAAWAIEGDRSEFSKYATMSKDFATRAARLHSAEAGEIIGLLSLQDNSSLARFYDDARLLEEYAGTHDEQLTLLSNKLGI